MSYNTLDTQSKDIYLQNRIVAATTQEAYENAAVHDTAYAVGVRQNPAESIRMVWPVCFNTESEYASALANNVPNPGQDESVISDGMILSAIQANWPPDPAA